MKISVFITAHISSEPCHDDSMVIYSHEYENRNFLSSGEWPFLHWLARNFPLLDWNYDDGYDTDSSDYSQYVAYTEGDNSANYVLATLEVED